MKKKFLVTLVLLPVVVVMIAAGGRGSSEDGVATLTAGTYEELYNHLKSINPDGGKHETYKDEYVVIELTGDLEAKAVGTETDSATGATLKIARGNVTIDGKGNTIESKGLPSFYVVGSDPASSVKGIVIKNLTVNEGAIDKENIRGGAMYFAGYADVELSDCVFTNCLAKTQGGGVLHTNGWGDDSMYVAIKNCTFKGNSAPDGTGGALLGLRSKIDITGSAFENNSAALGGAILTTAKDFPSSVSKERRMKTPKSRQASPT